MCIPRSWHRFLSSPLVAELVVSGSASVVLAQGVQPPHTCATALQPTDVPVVRALQAAGVWNLHAGGLDQPLPVPLAMHVVRRNNGTGGLPQGFIDECVADATVAFASANISFYQTGPTQFINSDALYTIDDLTETNTLRQMQVVPDAINVYFVGDAYYCGISSFTFSAVQGIVMNNLCTPLTGDHGTFPHEVGHYFDLFHTHETAMGVECVARTNCTTAGDLLCDTPADPNLIGRVNGSCAFTGGVDNPCNHDPPYSPDPRNYMSYAPQRCTMDFTNGQDSRALATLINQRPNLYGAASTRWVDFAYSGPENGSFAQPFNTFAEGVAAVPAGGTVRIKAGARRETGTFSRPCTVQSFNGDVTIGR